VITSARRRTGLADLDQADRRVVVGDQQPELDAALEPTELAIRRALARPAAHLGP
jgi:hypothetical protein